MPVLALRGGACALVVAGTSGGFLPARVTGLLLTTLSSTQIGLMWDANDAGDSVDEYLIERSTNGGVSYSQVGTTAGTTFTDTLTSGTHAYYRVRAHNPAGGNGAYSSVKNAWTLPDQATGLAAVAVGGQVEIDLTWSAVTGAATYEVQRQRGTGAFSIVATGLTSPALNDTSGLLPGTLYTYQVRAVDPAGPGAWSASASATTDTGSRTLQVSLAEFWALDEGSGNANRVGKVSGYALTAHGAPTQTTARCGLGCTFDGISQYLSAADAGSGDPTRFGNGRSWTLGIVVNPTTSGSKFVLLKGDLAGTHFEVHVQIGSDQNAYCYIEDGSRVVHTKDAEIKVGVDNLILIWLDRAGNTLNIRANGGEVETTDITGVTITERGAQFSIGRTYQGYYDVRVSAIPKWDRTINSDERDWELNFGFWRSFDEVNAASVVPFAPSAGPTTIYDAVTTSADFCGLIYYPPDDHFYSVFRVGLEDAYSASAHLLVRKCPASADTTNPGNWSDVATLTSPDAGHLDAFDPKITLLPDGTTLMVNGGLQNSGGQTVSACWKSADGSTWDSGHVISGPATNEWIWRAEPGPDANVYGFAYTAVSAGSRVTELWKSTDGGLTYTELVAHLDSGDGGNASEMGALFRSTDGKLFILERMDGGAVASRMSGWVASPYDSGWSFRNCYTFAGQRYASPQLIELPGGRILGIVRAFIPNQRQSLVAIEPETGTGYEIAQLNGNNSDTGYGAAVLRNGKINLIYHEFLTNRTVIKAAVFPVPA